MFLYAKTIKKEKKRKETVMMISLSSESTVTLDEQIIVGYIPN